jgi:hypothetical protein
VGHLTYLIDEICAGLEIYYSGRTGGQYLKTAFILCDDYTELVSKLFLLEKSNNWSDSKPNGKFKNYYDVQKDVKDFFAATRATDLPKVQVLHDAMEKRRGRRNDFFHSTSLLDLNVSQRNCVDAFCDLLEYGELLFGSEWQKELTTCRDLETLQVLLLLEKRAFSDTTITPKVSTILSKWPRREKDRAVYKRGTQYAEYPEDLHLRLCVIWGGPELLQKLKALLTS